MTPRPRVAAQPTQICMVSATAWSLGTIMVPGYWATTWSLTATGTTGIYPDLDGCTAMKPDMALGSSLGLDKTMAPGDSTGLPDQCGSSVSTALSHEQGHRLQPSPQVPVWPLLAIWAMDVNTYPGCCRAIEDPLVEEAYKLLIQHKQQLAESKTIWTSLHFSNTCLPRPFPWVPADIAAYWLEPHYAKRRKTEVFTHQRLLISPNPLACIHFSISPAAQTGHFLHKASRGQQSTHDSPYCCQSLKTREHREEDTGP